MENWGDFYDGIIEEKLAIIETAKSADKKPKRLKDATMPRGAANEGHRSRLDDKVMSPDIGLAKLADHEQLEWIMYNVLSRNDTNPLAHKLLKEFKTVANVFNADYEDLLKIEGVGSRTAKFLTQIPGVSAIYEQSKMRRLKLDEPEKICDYAKTLFEGETYECFFLICLDASRKLINHKLIAKGSITEIPIYARQIIDIIYKNKTQEVIFAHNHPSGNLMASGEDIKMTRELVAKLRFIEVGLLDHVIYAGGECYSMRANGVMDLMENI